MDEEVFLTKYELHWILLSDIHQGQKKIKI